jgi:phosphoribosylaminoimidazole carboxylase (NCAIR synthetase)
VVVGGGRLGRGLVNAGNAFGSMVFHVFPALLPKRDSRAEVV